MIKISTQQEIKLINAIYLIQFTEKSSFSIFNPIYSSIIKNLMIERSRIKIKELKISLIPDFLTKLRKMFLTSFFLKLREMDFFLYLKH